MVGRINQGPPVSGGGVAAPLSGGRAPIPAEIKTNEAGPVDRTDSRSDPRTLLGLDDAAAKSDWRRGKTDPAASRAKVTSLTGFMGAFTTFSTFMFESGQLLRDAEWMLVEANVGGQTVIGLIALFAGLAVARIV